MIERESRTVLIVDGNPKMLYHYGILLKRLDYTVLTAVSPNNALKILDIMSPSLILTEICLVRRIWAYKMGVREK